MVTINLSDKMAEKIWKKLQYKQNKTWIYLRERLFESTGFPQAVKKLKKGEALQVEVEMRVSPTFRIGTWIAKFGMFLMGKSYSINVKSVKGDA